MFLLIGIPAALLDGIIRSFDHFGVTLFTRATLSLLEHGILAIDALGAAISILVRTYRDIKKMLDE